MRLASLRSAACVVLLSLATAGLAHAEKPPAISEDAAGGLATLVSAVAQPAADAAPAERPVVSASKSAPASSGRDTPIVGQPEPSGYAITGNTGWLAPSEQLAGRQTALRFRFQQQMQSGDRPWLPRK
jgi:hypothetical protein